MSYSTVSQIAFELMVDIHSTTMGLECSNLFTSFFFSPNLICLKCPQCFILPLKETCCNSPALLFNKGNKIPLTGDSINLHRTTDIRVDYLQ